MENCSQELDAIRTAILNEHEGYQFYLLAAEKGVSEEVRDVFLYLAEEEHRHEYYLRKLYEAIEQNQGFNSGNICRPVEQPKVFIQENMRGEQPSLIVSALSMLFSPEMRLESCPTIM